MKTYSRHLPEVFLATAIALGCSSAFGQSLAMSYNLNGESAQRTSAAACPTWLRGASCGQNEPVGRFSRDATVGTRPSVQKTSVSAPARPAEPSLIPYLGEAANRSSDARAPTGDAAQADFNFHFGSRARVGRNEDDLERRLRNSAYESRASRSSFNAVGLELVVPIQTRVVKSLDPAPPE